MPSLSVYKKRAHVVKELAASWIHGQNTETLMMKSLIEDMNSDQKSAKGVGRVKKDLGLRSAQEALMVEVSTVQNLRCCPKVMTRMFGKFQ